MIIAGGTHSAERLRLVVDLVRTLLPEMERAGIAMAADVGIETLLERMMDEVKRSAASSSGMRRSPRGLDWALCDPSSRRGWWAYDRLMSAESLLPLREVTSHLRILGEHYVGVQEIPVERIVGSVDRSVDFDQVFRPRRRELRRRLDALAEVFGDRPMPPITVYEASGLYFVSDGHHRVALAHRQKSAFIDAEVTHLEVSNRLHAGVDLLELIHTEQHRRFKERTHLMDVAPGADIEFSRPIGYGELLQVIEAHAFELSEARGTMVSLPDATRDWYTSCWLPALAAIGSTGLARAYDFKTDGDRYLWTHRKLQELRAMNGQASWEDAARALAKVPVARSHRQETLASRRKPLPTA